jgi:putative ABC transport system permease protein
MPDGDPIGRHFRYYGMDSLNEPTMTIVGVIGNVRNDSLASPPTAEAYVSYLQRPARTREPMIVVARARQAGALGSLLTALRSVMASVDADVPARIGTMEGRVADSVADRRFTMAVLSTFAMVALMLAAVGIYGVLSQTVLQRTPEIGVRMALGAEAGGVLRMMMGAAMRPVLAGIACGVAGAALSVRVLRGLLFGVTTLDPAAFTAAAALLIGVALLAAYIPARRATRVDPLKALRAQ